MRKDVSAGEEVQNQNIRKNDKKRRFRRSKVKFQKIRKMMRKAVSGDGVEKIRKNDEKRHFRRSKVKVQKIRKMMRKDVSVGQRSKFKKSEK